MAKWDVKVDTMDSGRIFDDTVVAPTAGLAMEQIGVKFKQLEGCLQITITDDRYEKRRKARIAL